MCDILTLRLTMVDGLLSLEGTKKCLIFDIQKIYRIMQN
jgi:hypothetical protein